MSVYFKVDIISFYEETNGRISNSIVILILPISKRSLFNIIANPPENLICLIS